MKYAVVESSASSNDMLIDGGVKPGLKAETTF